MTTNGPTGPTGPTGATGPAGIGGSMGPTGSRGATGPAGTGVTGPTGAAALPASPGIAASFGVSYGAGPNYIIEQQRIAFDTSSTVNRTIIYANRDPVVLQVRQNESNYGAKIRFNRQDPGDVYFSGVASFSFWYLVTTGETLKLSVCVGAPGAVIAATTVIEQTVCPIGPSRVYRSVSFPFNYVIASAISTPLDFFLAVDPGTGGVGNINVWGAALSVSIVQ